MRGSDAPRLLLRLACFLPLAAAPALTNWICTQATVERWLGRGLDGIAVTLIAGKTIWINADLRPLKAAWIARMPDSAAIRRRPTGTMPRCLGGSQEMTRR